MKEKVPFRAAKDVVARKIPGFSGQDLNDAVNGNKIVEHPGRMFDPDDLDALAAQIAATHPELPALVLVSPYVSMPRRLALAARAAPALSLLMRYPRSADQRSIHDDEERAKSLGFGIFPMRTLAELRRTAARGWAALPQIQAPTLVIQSREDNRITVSAAQRAYARLGSPQKRLEWIEGAGHVLTVDYGREHVFSLIVQWLEMHGGATAAIADATSSLRDRPGSLPPL